MSLEIERKFLVAHLPDLGGMKSFKVRQGYLTQPADSTELRLRQMNDTFFLTLKGEGDLVRIEREVEISAAQFAVFWPETRGRRVEKQRFNGQLPGGQEFELDVFEGNLAALRLVEIEFGSEDDAHQFQPPDWFGAEVTGARQYKNKVLAVEGLPI